MTRLRVQFDGKVLVPLEPVDLPTGRPLEADVWEAADLAPGSPALLLRAMRQEPHIRAEDVDALEQAIKSDCMPAKDDGAFDDLI